MEDHSKSNAQRKDDSERNIVELTSDMEVQDQDGNDIIDLTNAIDTPLETPISPKPSEPSPEGIAAMQTASDPAANAALEGQPTVEAQVDAAFDRVGTLEEPKPTAVDSKEQLFDQLSGLTQQVDSVIEETTADETDSAAPERHPEDAEQETSSSNAEWLDAPMAPVEDDEGGMAVRETDSLTEDNDEVLELTDVVEPPTEDEVLELTDIVEPTAEDEVLELTDVVEPPTEDEVLELTDIVEPPAEDEVLELTDIVEPTAEDEVLELTDIVEPPAEDEVLELTDVVEPPAEDEILELTDIVEPPAEDEVLELTEIVEPPAEDEVLELTDVVEPPAEDEIPELTDIVEPTAQDEVLELTDVVEPPTEDEIPELTDIVEPPAEDEVLELTDVVEPPTEDEVLELTDVVEPAVDDEALEPDEPIAPEDDEIMELTDIVQKDEPFELAQEAGSVETTVAPAEEEEAVVNHDTVSDDQVIQLSDILKESKMDRPPMGEVKMGAEEDLQSESIPLEQEEVANALGLDLEEEAVLDRKILAAVEQVLQQKYSDSIEQRIANAVETAVKREIEAIKRTISEDDDTIV